LTDRKKPGVAFWATVVTVVVGGPILYLASMGLTYRLLILTDDPSGGWRWDTFRAVYAPILWVYDNGPEPVHEAINLLCGCNG
jgi:hypothetical protein